EAAEHARARLDLTRQIRGRPGEEQQRGTGSRDPRAHGAIRGSEAAVAEWRGRPPVRGGIRAAGGGLARHKPPFAVAPRAAPPPGRSRQPDVEWRTAPPRAAVRSPTPQGHA